MVDPHLSACFSTVPYKNTFQYGTLSARVSIGLAHTRFLYGTVLTNGDHNSNSFSALLSITFFQFEDSNDNANGNKQYEVCGVCKEKVEFKSWYDHIMLNHDYMAWKLEDPPLVSIFIVIKLINYKGLVMLLHTYFCLP